MSDPEWVDPVEKDLERAVRALLERRQPPAFKLTDTVRVALFAIVVILSYPNWMSSRCCSG